MSVFASLDLPTLLSMRAESIAALHDLMTRATSLTNKFGDSATYNQRRSELKAHIEDLDAVIATKEGGTPSRGPIYLVGGR
jgi:hypothetical protein